MTTESLQIKEGLACLGAGGQNLPQNSPQIAVLSDPMEHLPAPEGPDDLPTARTVENRCKRAKSAAVLCGTPNLGTGSGERAALIGRLFVCRLFMYAHAREGRGSVQALEAGGAPAR